MERRLDARVARGRVEDAPGYIAVMISYVQYRRVLEYLEAIQSPLKPDELIACVLEGWLRGSTCERASREGALEVMSYVHSHAE